MHTILLRLTAMAATTMLLVTSCGGGSGLLPDKAYRQRVETDYRERSELLGRSEALKIVDDATLTPREREALKFLYAYMPLSDAINYDGSYFLENVRLSEQTRTEMPWGATIPTEIYRHFVLPVRVNNEDLDASRRVFHDELADRVRGMSMADAILEVNHWCHEKAVYGPTDSRTSAPLATVRTAVGRCGEESTLLVAALRSVGIPARQVYTPRWAHTDDNHAWVEAWADGKWYFLGACEPEPVLNLGWFNAPASRGMLFHTNVFGYYEGPEPVMRRTRLFTEINITDNYAPTSTVEVLVTDPEGRAVPGATVDYKVYNYSELYSVASQPADAEGRSSIRAGRGDVVVWASDGDRYGFAKASLGKDSTVTVTLDKGPGTAVAAEFFIVPPVESGELPAVSEAQRAENTRRMAVEDSIRNAYVSTFRTEAQAADFARAHGLDVRRTTPLLVEAKGNYAAVEAFLAAAAADGEGDRAVRLLELVTKKDLHDTPQEVFDDHLRHTQGTEDAVLNPRVGIELLSAYRGYLQERLPADAAAQFRADPQRLVSWCRDSLRLEEAGNLRLVPIRPKGVWESRVVDATSRDLFFVAVCRSLGIPAWRDAVTGKVWYNDAAGRACAVDFEAPAPEATDYGTLKLTYTPTAAVPDPRYYNHFTLSRLENGRMRLLNYGDGDTWNGLFRRGARLEAGDYVLVSGTRLSGGEVLAEVRVFTIGKDATTEVALTLPAEERTGEVLGTFDTAADCLDAAGQTMSLHDALGQGYAVLGVLGAGEEPTNHALHDMAAFRASFEELGVPVVLLFANEENSRRFVAEDFPALPTTVRFGSDVDATVLGRLTAGAGLSRGELPVIAVTDSFGRIFYVSSGYSIGLGERLVKELTALKTQE